MFQLIGLRIQPAGRRYLTAACIFRGKVNSTEVRYPLPLIDS